jgi:hypothetical protein
MGGAMMAYGVGCSIEQKMVPLVKMSYLVILRTDTPMDRVLGILARLLASVGRRRTFDLLVRCHYY